MCKLLWTGPHLIFVLFYFSSFSLIDIYSETKPGFPKVRLVGFCQHYKENKEMNAENIWEVKSINLLNDFSGFNRIIWNINL